MQLLDKLMITISYTISFIPAIRLLYYPFERVMSRKNLHCLYLVMTGVFVVLFGWSFFWFLSFGVSDLFYKLNSGGFYVLFLIILCTFMKDKKAAILFNFGIVGICILTISSMSYFMVETFPMKYTNLETAFIYYGLIAIFYLPMRWFINKNVDTLMPISKGSEWSDIWFLPFSILIVCVFSIPLQSHTASLFELICRLMCGVFAIFICYYLSHSREVQIEKNRIIEELKSQKAYYSALANNIQQERKVRHDFRHAVTAIRTYIDREDRDGLVEYCEKLLDYSSGNIETPFTGNAVADGIFYRYSQLAKENNVRFEIQGSFRDDMIDDMDLCLLLGNALENSMEACQRMQQGEREIAVGIEETENLLTITIRNSYASNIKMKKEKILSSKRKNSEEGIGLRSIREVCEKYGGTMHVTFDNREFNLMVLLNRVGKNK